MKRLAAVVLLFCTVGLLWFAYTGNSTEEHSGFTNYRVISHAMGAIRDDAYTNSYEAFIANYEKGNRVFEVDLMWTSDGKLVARHEWTAAFTQQMKQQQVVPSEQGGTPWTYEQFEQAKILDAYTPLDWDQVVDLLEKYPDAYIVTDTKEQEPEQIRKLFVQLTETAEKRDPALLNRIVPQIYDEDMLQMVRSVYPYPSVIYTLYATEDTDEQVVQFVQEHDIAAVTMPETRLNGTFIENLRQAGAISYVHTINEISDAAKYEQMGVYGVYTDVLTEKDLEDTGWMFAWLS